MLCSWKSAAVAYAASVTVASAQPALPLPIAASLSNAAQQAAAGIGPSLTLEQCIAAAIDRDGRQRAAGHEIDIATARRGQALSSRYPSLSATLAATRFDEDPNFIFPSSTMGIPASSITIPPMVMTLPANAFGPGFPPVPVPMQIPGSAMAVPAQLFEVPEQDVRLMDKTLYSGTVKAMYAIYTGGLAGARIAQTRAGVEAARHGRQQTSAEIAFDVTRAYYGVVLAHKLRTVAAETYERMKVTLDLTESLYKTGSGRVKKTDYLRHSAMVDTIASMVTEFEAQERTARAALGMLIGWTGTGEPQLASDDFAASAPVPAIDTLVGEALAGSPRIGQIDAGLVATKAGVRAAQAGHLPKVALFANLTLLGNSYDAGLVSSRNRTTWSVGLGVDVPIFEGFRVTHEVNEAKAAERKLAALSSALRDGVSLDVRRVAIAIDKSLAQRATTGNAYKSSTENRELHIRAYQDELVETKDMIESQLVEAVLAGQFFKVQFDLVEAQASLDLLLGRAGPGRH